MVNKDVKIFVDFVNGVVGTLYKKGRDKGQADDFVTIEYYPHNRFIGSKCVYPQIENKYLHHIAPVQKEKMEGIANEFVIYYDPTKKCVIGDFFKNNDQKRILKLEEDIAQLRVENAGLKRDLEKANIGASSKVAEAQKTLKTKSGDSGNSLGNGLPIFNRGW